MKVCFGTTRMVFLVGKYAIKVPTFNSFKLFLYGLLGNMQEAEFSRAFKTEGVLAPVLFFVPGGFFSVMQRAEPLPMKDFERLDVERWSDRSGWFVPVEEKQDSFGSLGGKVVAIDYGSQGGRPWSNSNRGYDHEDA